MAIDKCLILLKDFKLNLDDSHSMEFFDSRNKHVEACLDKVYELHKIFDEELIKYSEQVNNQIFKF